MQHVLGEESIDHGKSAGLYMITLFVDQKCTWFKRRPEVNNAGVNMF